MYNLHLCLSIEKEIYSETNPREPANSQMKEPYYRNTPVQRYTSPATCITDICARMYSGLTVERSDKCYFAQRFVDSSTDVPSQFADVFITVHVQLQRERNLGPREKVRAAAFFRWTFAVRPASCDSAIQEFAYTWNFILKFLRCVSISSLAAHVTMLYDVACVVTCILTANFNLGGIFAFLLSNREFSSRKTIVLKKLSFIFLTHKQTSQD